MIQWLIGAGVGVSGVVVALWTLWRKAKVERDRDAALAVSRSLLQKTAELDSRLVANEVLRHEDTARYARVIRDLRTEIAVMEADLDLVQDPSVVRDRLRRMLSHAASGTASPVKLVPTVRTAGGTAGDGHGT